MLPWTGCAPVMPPLAGGDVAALGRGQISVGGAARMPTGALRAHGPELPLYTASPGGVAPLVQGRLGVERNTDMGVMAMPGLFALELRRRVDVGGDWRVLGSGTLFGGWLEPREERLGSRGTRLGISMPWALARSLGGIYEVWAGGRLGAEYVRQGPGIAPQDDHRWPGYDGHVWRGGVFAGLAVGFDHVHGLFELSADYEHWRLNRWADGREAVWSAAGIAWTPAFALRVTF